MIPEAATLRDLLLARAASDGDRLAFDDGNRRVTYRQLAERAAGQAERLSSWGVRAGDRVAFAMSAGVSFAEAFWAAQLLGAATASFNPAVPAEALERRIAAVRPRLVIRDGLLDDAPASRKMGPDPAIGADDIAFLQPTSGTSGEPRAAMVRHRNVFAYLRSEPEGGSTLEDVVVSWAPPWHDLGLVRSIIGAVAYGTPCHIVEPAVRTIPLWLATIGRVGGTMSGAPDFAYRLAARMVDPASVDITRLRLSTNGGEPVRRSTVEEFERRFGLLSAVVPGYGLAEATLGVTSAVPGEPIVVDARGNVSCGPARPCVEARAGAGISAPGEILVRGESVFAGYFDAPAETEEVLRDGWLHTGDIGYFDEQGRLFVLGRKRVMIKRGGAVVAPRELEEAAQEVEGVRVAAAVGIPDATNMTETAVLAVEAPGAESERSAALVGAVSSAVAAAVGFAPGHVAVLPPRGIPRTENGKIRHDRLRELLLERFSAEAAESAAPARTR